MAELACFAEGTERDEVIEVAGGGGTGGLCDGDVIFSAEAPFKAFRTTLKKSEKDFFLARIELGERVVSIFDFSKRKLLKLGPVGQLPIPGHER